MACLGGDIIRLFKFSNEPSRCTRRAPFLRMLDASTLRMDGQHFGGQLKKTALNVCGQSFALSAGTDTILGKNRPTAFAYVYLPTIAVENGMTQGEREPFNMEILFMLPHHMSLPGVTQLHKRQRVLLSTLEQVLT